ncbi:M23 family metallopeptidase [Streptomyces sp. NPDC090306]|uniref:M23 family metallopeptidase n=1 Tax=Streptomyces sp. NPDC090306 TaxID=3365961 RepID=UPI0038077485
MNERHPSGIVTSPAEASEAAAAHYAPHGEQGASYDAFTSHDPYATGSFDSGAFATDGTGTATFATDPLFGDMAANGQAPNGGYGTTTEVRFDAAQATGTYDTGRWPQSGHGSGYETGAYGTGVHDTGAYDTTSWTNGYPHLSAVPPQSTGGDATGQWDAGTWAQPGGAGGSAADGTQQWTWGTQTFETGTFETGTFEPGAFASGPFDSGVYDATQWNADGRDGAPMAAPAAEHPDHSAAFAAHLDGFPSPAEEFGGHAQSPDAPRPEMFDQRSEPYDRQPEPPADRLAGHLDDGQLDDFEHELASTGEMPVVPALLDDQEEIVPAATAARSDGRNAGRSRRRSPAKRSALLTVAVPSVCVMGVAGIAAASIGGTHGDGGSATDTTASASDAHAVRPSAANNKLDTQLASLSAGADDFAGRASRTQERIDLKAEQAAEKKKAAEEAARKERLRPKFVLPVTQKGLSAYFGQAGVNWMSVHTGIDFPVSYGTTVMSATDGTVRTQWNSAYGNMAIVTAKDGTETWYCHLSSYRVASGTTVKAGDPIAYSGNSGNSTGPHLHFEVRPAGGAAIDPLPWLRSHGLDPT